MKLKTRKRNNPHARKRLVTIFFVVVLTTTMSLSGSVYGHEIFYYNGDYVPLKWDVQSSSGYYHTKVNWDYLPSNSVYYPHIQNAVNMWNASPTKALCTTESWSNSNVDIGTTDVYTWYNVYGCGSGTYMFTYLIDVNNVKLTGDEVAYNSSRRITNATIYANPEHTSSSGLGFDTQTKIALVAHEIGHVYTLGHPEQNITALMRGSPSTMSMTLQPHDISDMNAKYK